jgi:translation initiation factor 2-alpha kinase 4
MGRKDAPDADIAAKELLNWLKSEIRDRESRSGMKLRSTAGVPHSDSANALPTSATAETNDDQEVHVLVAQTKSKKFNRRAVVEQAHASASRLVRSFLEGPVAAIETSDAVMDLLRGTSLSDPETWRRVEHSVGTAEKKYVREIHDMLKQWRWEWEARKEGSAANAFVYNFRTGKCVYYDLGA